MFPANCYSVSRLDDDDEGHGLMPLMHQRKINICYDELTYILGMDNPAPHKAKQRPHPVTQIHAMCARQHWAPQFLCDL